MTVINIENSSLIYKFSIARFDFGYISKISNNLCYYYPHRIKKGELYEIN